MLTCTLLVALLSFVAGVAADVLLWRLLIPSEQAAAAGRPHGGTLLRAGHSDRFSGSRALPHQDGRYR